MPRELIAIAPRKLTWREYEEGPLGPNQVRIRSCFSAEKHGTTLPIYRGTSPVSQKAFDSELGIFITKDSGRGWSPSFPMSLGNMTVGVVTQVGSKVSRFKVGDRVYGHLPIRETHTVSEDAIEVAPPDLRDEQLVCIDPAEVALMAVREGQIRLGDTVAVFGLGAIGLIAVQMAKLSGALIVIGIEPIERRRRLARKYGVDILLDPKECDVGYEIRMKTGKKGVDVAIETSGSYQALHHSIRGTRYGGRVVPVAFYCGEAKELRLGEEFHFLRQTMISGARVESEPYRDYPLWDRKRVYETVIELLRKGKIEVDGLLCPIVNFEDALSAYKLVDERPEEAIKLGVKYPYRQVAEEIGD